MLRVRVCEDGGAPLPAIDVDDAAFVIGSAPAARIRLPVAAARAEHVRIADGRWHSADGAGDIGDGVELAIGGFRVHVAPAPAGAIATAPQRTESLARELLRGLLGDAGAPSLEALTGPVAGARRRLAPPESTLVIGRGDDAGWSIADPSLSRAHAEIRRGWDGIRVIDLGSSGGVMVDGRVVRDAPLHDGAVIALGATRLHFHDPAHPRPAAPSPSPSLSLSPSPVFYVAIAVLSAAIAGAIWLLVS